MLDINSAEHHKATHKLKNIIEKTLQSNTELKSLNSLAHNSLYRKIIINVLRELKFKLGVDNCTSAEAYGTWYILDNTNENVYIKLGVPKEIEPNCFVKKYNEITFNFDELKISEENYKLINEMYRELK